MHEMGIAQGYDSGHPVPPPLENHSRRASNDMLGTLPIRYDTYALTKAPGPEMPKVMGACS